MFQLMLNTVRQKLASSLMRLSKAPELRPAQSVNEGEMNYQHQQPKSNLPPTMPQPDTRSAELTIKGGRATLDILDNQSPSRNMPSLKPETVRRVHKKLGRNDPCYCGSGKKYKHCCYAKDRQTASY